VRLSLAVGFMGDWPWRVAVDDREMTALSGTVAGPLLKTFSGLEKYLFVVILPCAC